MSSTNSPITFSGSSTYSADFQNVIQRAVSIASLPIQAEQTSVSTLSNEQSALAGLAANFSALQTALQSVGTAAQGSPAAQVSDSTVLSAVASAGALNGSYTVQVDNVGSYSTSMSTSGLTTVTDPTAGNISSSSLFTLAVNGVAHTITPSGASLESLATALNSASLGVQATIVNVGSTSSPDYRLAVTSTSLAPDTLQLGDGTNNLLTALSTGANAQYKVNGTASDVSSTSDKITLAPGLTATLLQQNATPVTISVSTSYATLQSALTNFANAYNAGVDALAQQRGQNGGSLAGQSIIYTLTDVLQSISQYSGNGAIGSLTDLGLSLDQAGHLSLDSTALTAANASDIQAFLGSVGGGTGFLNATTASLTSVTDSTSGLLQASQSAVQNQITSENANITAQQLRVNDLQTSLQAQLSAADAAIATLQSQKTYFQELFTATYGNGTNTLG